MSKTVFFTIVIHILSCFTQVVNIFKWIKFLAKDTFQNSDIYFSELGQKKAYETFIRPLS